MVYFEYKGRKSSDFFLFIERNVSFGSAGSDISLEEVPGVDGDLAISNQRLKGLDKIFPCRLRLPSNKKIEDVTNDISNWLKTDISWDDLFFSEEPQFVYRALYYEEYDVERIVSFYGKTTLKFRIKPYKYFKDSLDPIEVTNGQYITNKGTRPSKPLLRVEGTGDITVKFGSNQLQLKGIDQGIIVDLQAQVVTSLDGSRPAYDKVYTYPFPDFPIGKQKVSWTGNATKVEITPRWEVIV
ncbi:distal tail protein Dit [Enterococcus hirae]|uniref:distal tail protein Dit n=1 Tax=Enterococcus hirae TaxID=1354 RepID=UPI000F711811|nr:distal tail protein Dit [Enterococcus hirae]VEE82045.1 phage putative tail component protein [Enterococcus hirae]